MAKYVSTTSQTLTAVGNPIIFQQNAIKGCCAIFHRPGSAIIQLSGNRCNPVIYKVSVHANISGLQAPMQLGIYQDGEELTTARMSVVAAGTGNILSVDSTTLVAADCCCTNISVRTLTAGITVNSAEITVEKEE